MNAMHETGGSFWKHPDAKKIKAAALFAEGVAKRQIARQLGVSSTTVNRWVKDTPTVNGDTVTPTPQLELRPYEADWVKRIKAAKERRVLAVGPTGSGKTVVAAHLIQKAVKARKRVLFLAHRRELIDQCVDRLKAMGVSAQVGVILAGRDPDPEAPVQVASIQTLHHRDLPLADDVWIDEAHHAPAAGIRKIVDAYPAATIRGLTATPCRLDGKALGDCFDRIVEGPTIEELVELGYLSKPRVFSWPADLEDVEIRAGDFAADQASARMSKRKIVDDVVGRWQALAQGRPTVVYAVDVRHAQRLTKGFQQAGVECRLLTGETPVEAREDMLAALEHGSVKVIINVGVLTEGWDSQAAAVGVVARPTMSLALWLQICGRFMRPGGNKLIIDHGGNAIRFGRPTEPRHWSLDGAQPTARRESPEKACPSCGSREFLGARECGSCGYVFWQAEPPQYIARQLVELTTSPRERGLEMLRQGASNKEVSEALGVCNNTVWKWKREAGFKNRYQVAEEQKQRGLEMLKQGASNKEVSEALGVCNNTVCTWKREAGINRYQVAEEQKQRGLEMLKQGASNKEVIEALGVGHNTVRTWKREAGIKNRYQVAEEQKQRGLEMLRQGASNKEVIEALGVSNSTVRRLKRGLQP